MNTLHIIKEPTPEYHKIMWNSKAVYHHDAKPNSTNNKYIYGYYEVCGNIISSVALWH